MRFSQSTHLLMFLPLETLASIMKTGLTILVELTDLVNSAIISNNLTQMVYFPIQIQDCNFHSPAFLVPFLSFDTSICSTMALSQLGNSDHVVVSVLIDILSYSQRDALFYHIMTILMLIGMVFEII